jgi:hypothetical protein
MICAASSMIAADRLPRRSAALALIAACALTPALARADGPTKAEQLFREGRALLDAKKYDEACAKLAESQRLEPGAGTLLALALCHEGQGKPATASAELKEASELGRKNGRNDLAAAADKRAQALEASVPHLVVHLPEKGGATYDVKCDGEPIGEDELDSPLAMDPGEHRIEVSAEGKASRSYVVRISGPGTTEIVVDRLEDAARPAPKEAAPARRPDAEAPPPDVTPESRGGAQRTVGLVLVGAGVVGLGVGAYFGGRALSQSSEASRLCPKANEKCTGAGEDANQRSRNSFRAAVISLAAGTGLLTIGAIVYFLAPSGPAAQAVLRDAKGRTAYLVPTIGPDGGSLGLAGTF